jgi:Leucine-rich repeat (LRR) protein
MGAENILIFAGYKLWCITGSDLDEAELAVNNEEVDGIFVSRHRGYTGQSLACLGKFENLRIIAIDDAKGIDISPLQHLLNLEYLSIGEADGPIKLDGLLKLKQLRLKIAKDRNLPKEGLPNLLGLAVWDFSGPDLSILAGYPQLKSLEVTQARKLTSLLGIDYCKQLSNVVVAYAPVLHNIEALAALKELKNLELQNCRKIQSYDAIGKLFSLKKLIIDKAASLDNLHFMSGLRNLEHLVIRNSAVENNDLSELKPMPFLSHIYLDNKKEYEPILSELKKMVQDRKKFREK